MRRKPLYGPPTPDLPRANLPPARHLPRALNLQQLSPRPANNRPRDPLHPTRRKPPHGAPTPDRPQANPPPARHLLQINLPALNRQRLNPRPPNNPARDPPHRLQQSART